MLDKCKKPIMFICLCLSVLFATLGCGLLNGAGRGNSLLPIRILKLTIDKSQREELFDQLQKFADKHGFETQLTDFNTNGENFQFWMSKENIEIVANNAPPDPTLVSISFYAAYPGASVDEETVDELFNDLKSFISEILMLRLLKK
jgi:hypothetical protein